MSNKKDTIINIMNELIPEICPEEQEIFELYSDAFYEEAISTDKRNKMGDDCYFGEVVETVIAFLLGALVTVEFEETYKGSGKAKWPKLRDYFLNNKNDFKNIKRDLYQKIIKVLEQKVKEAEKGEQNTMSSVNVSTNDDEKK